MKNFAKKIVLIALSLFALIARVSAISNPSGIFDENGNGSVGTPQVPISGSLAVDPISGMTTLCYILPATVTSGDVLLYEEQQGSNHISDIIRFEGNQLFFFSLIEPGEQEPTNRLADVSVLPALQANVGGPIPEGLSWSPTPSSGLPGSVPLLIPLYEFNSDVPEPGSLGLMGLAGLMTVFWRAKKRRAAT